MPQETRKLLEQLEAKYGMDLTHFRQLHHFMDRASITAHHNYCQDRSRFRAGGENERVRKRLRLTLDVLAAGGTWESAIRDALRRVPL